jgi:hypothetical protein
VTVGACRSIFLGKRRGNNGLLLPTINGKLCRLLSPPAIEHFAQ